MSALQIHHEDGKVITALLRTDEVQIKISGVAHVAMIRHEDIPQVIRLLRAAEAMREHDEAGDRCTICGLPRYICRLEASEAGH